MTLECRSRPLWSRDRFRTRQECSLFGPFAQSARRGPSAYIDVYRDYVAGANFKEFATILALEIKSGRNLESSVGYRKFCDFCSLRDNVMGRNKKVDLKYKAACAAMGLALLHGGSALADDADGDGDDIRNMNQITVYGEKRETTLQDAPIALSAIEFGRNAPPT